MVENDGTTNLTLDNGSILLWFSPDWSSASAGGSGPGDWAPLIQVGQFATNGGLGAWALEIDPAGANLEFVVQGSDGCSVIYLTAPIAFTNNTWHFIALTYSTATNSALYVDGELLTNGLPVTCLPGAAAVTNGFFIGSDPMGTQQMGGMMDDLSTYNFPLDGGTVGSDYFLYSLFYGLEMRLASAPSYPTNTPTFWAVSGPGYLGYVGTSGNCAFSNKVWFTAVSASLVTNAPGSNSLMVTLTIGGGWPNVLYDLFGTVWLQGTNTQWAWLGQCTNCSTWALPYQVNANEFFILGSTNDATGCGVTDAYKVLVLHANPLSASNDGMGTPDAWYALEGLVPLPKGTADFDGDGLLNWQEYLWGTNPKVVEGFTVWVASPAGPAGIP